jgi:integrase/recombinase XerD
VGSQRTNHEITKLRICDIVLKESYGQGTIPSDTKTGGGPIVLRCSFAYVRDWLNEHPFKNEPKARLICSLRNGAAINPDAIQRVMKRLRCRIKRIVESGNLQANNEERQKLEFLLRTKKWNPYCIRHSAIDADAAYLQDSAVIKKVRWVPGSKQFGRYIRRRMNDELTNKILEHYGIKLNKPVETVLSNRTCGRCGYVNKLESKYCENSAKGCNYPLTQEAFEEIKKTEKEEVKKLIAASTRALNERITELQDRIELDVRFVKEEIKTLYESRKKKEDWWNKRDPNCLQI